MELAEEFALELPIFSKIILENKIIKTDGYTKFGTKYKDIYLGWGINRYRVDSNSMFTITNFGPGDYNEIIWNIYINTLDLYDELEDFGLDELGKLDCVFFYDILNSTFYIKENGITEFLEKLNSWYLSAREKVTALRIEKRKKELEEELSKLKQ